jgi:hypothetical protein
LLCCQALSRHWHDGAFFDTRHQMDQLTLRAFSGLDHLARVTTRHRFFSPIHPQPSQLLFRVVARQAFFLENGLDILPEVNFGLYRRRQRSGINANSIVRPGHS